MDYNVKNIKAIIKAIKRQRAHTAYQAKAREVGVSVQVNQFIFFPWNF